MLTIQDRLGWIRNWFKRTKQMDHLEIMTVISGLNLSFCQSLPKTMEPFSASGRMRLGGKRRLACSRWENWDFIQNQIFHFICFQIVPTGKPSPLTACQIVNKTLTSLKVQCQEGKSLFWGILSSSKCLHIRIWRRPACQLPPWALWCWENGTQVASHQQSANIWGAFFLRLNYQQYLNNNI